jgi:hypothetical protein
MNTPIDLFIGAPLELQAEILFLDHLLSSLEGWGEPVILCANFLTKGKPHQIDFLVITPRCVCHVELKSLTAPVIGQINGQWSLCLPGDKRWTLQGKNPYRQALDTKYALSDALRDFAKKSSGVPWPADGKQFYTTFETVVCVHPRLLPGSQVPSDYKVGVVGTDHLLTFLRTRQRAPGWSRAQWLDFIMDLGLERRQSEEPAARTAREQQALLTAYRQRCEASLRQGLPALVPTTAIGPDGAVGTETLRDLLARREHVQLVGPSGAGKSHLARYLALAELEAGGLVLIIPAREFEDRLSALLNRSVAHLHPGAAIEILDAAQKTGMRLSLVLDGVNECPPQLCKRLLRDLQSLVLRWPLPVLFTAREPSELPSELQGPLYEFSPLTQEQRAAILRAHAPAGVGDEAFWLCDTFGTAYELSLAAAVLGDLPPAAHRAELFDAYIRLRCDETRNPITARLLLVALAQLMHDRVKSSLTQLELWQVTEPLCAQHGARPQLVRELIDGGVLESRRGRVSFRHELLEQFFQAEALVRTHPEGQDLSARLQRPICQRLVPLALGLLTDAGTALEVLRAQSSSSLLADCVRGECGPVAREAALAECGEAIRAGFRSLDDLDLHIEQITAGEMEVPHVVGGLDLPLGLRAGLHAVGLVLGEGLFLDQALALAKQTDDACRSALERRGVRPTRLVLHALYSQFLVMNQQAELPTLPSALVHHGAEARRFRAPRPTMTEQMTGLVGTLGDRSPGELFLLCNLCHSPTEAISELLPELLQACWSTGLYHLRLEALQVAEGSVGVLSGGMREQVIEILGGLESRNVFLSSAIVDALLPYGMVESPVSREQAALQVAEILGAAQSEETCRAAYYVVANQLEEIVSEAYSGAYEELEPFDRERLLVLGLLGAPDDAFSADWMMGELVKVAGPASLPALRRWAAVPSPDAFSSQQRTSCFLRAVAGCARLLDRPPGFGAAAGEDAAAWVAYGEILFWLQRPGLADAERRAKCVPLWERLLTDLAFQAVDPLLRFASALFCQRAEAATVLTTLAQAFPDEVTRVLTFGLRNHSRLTTLFRHGPHDGYLEFLITWIGRLGDQHSAPLLEAFLESPKLGLTAADALRAIRSR